MSTRIGPGNRSRLSAGRPVPRNPENRLSPGGPRVGGMQIGAHVDQTDPIAEAAARQAPLVQFFLGDPQGYKGPEFRYAGGAEGLRDDAAAAGVDLYVHAPYIVNVATTNNRIRIPSRKLLQQHVDAAAVDRREGADRPRRPRQQGRRPRRWASTTGARPSTPSTSSSRC